MWDEYGTFQLTLRPGGRVPQGLALGFKLDVGLHRRLLQQLVLGAELFPFGLRLRQGRLPSWVQTR